jgi:hypothetical protein
VVHGEERGAGRGHGVVARLGGERTDEPGPSFIQLAEHHVQLRREVPEERAPADAPGDRELVDGGLVEALRGEQLERHVLEALGHRDPSRAPRRHHKSIAYQAAPVNAPTERTEVSHPVNLWRWH